MTTPSRILIVKPSALGDVIQALPVATGLKRHWPQARIDWIINDAYQDLLAGHPAIDRLVLYPRKRWKSPLCFPEVWRWARDLRQQQYDLVIDLQGLLRSGLMTAATKSPRRIGLKSAREGARHFYTEQIDDYPLAAAERYLCALEHLGIAPQRFDFQLQPTAPLPDALASRTGRYIILHPYSRWHTKLWPWRNYQAVINQMPQHHFVVLGEGPWFPIEGANLTDLRGRLNLSTLMTVLAKAQAVLSTDSGPAHLAAALEVPTLVLFGATDWHRTKPAGRKVKVLTHDVFCAPCLKRRCYRDVPMECLTGISADSVVSQLLMLLR